MGSDKFSPRHSSSFRRKSLDDVSPSSPKRQRLEETSSERVSGPRRGDTGRKTSPAGTTSDTNLDKYEKLLSELRRLGSSQLEVWLSYINKPETHPEYPEEWKKYWKTKYKSLCEEGEDPKTYDFKADWVVHWDEFIMARMNKEIETMKIARFNKEHVEKIVEDKISFNLVNAEGKKVVLDQSSSFKDPSDRLKPSEANPFITINRYSSSKPDKAPNPKHGSPYGYSKNQYSWQRTKPGPDPQGRKSEDTRGHHEFSQSRNGHLDTRHGMSPSPRETRRPFTSTSVPQVNRPSFSREDHHPRRRRSQENAVVRRMPSPERVRDDSGYIRDVPPVRHPYSSERRDSPPPSWSDKRGLPRERSRERYGPSREDSRDRRVISRRDSGDRRNVLREGSERVIGLPRGGLSREGRPDLSRVDSRDRRNSRGDSGERRGFSRDGSRDRREQTRDRPDFPDRHSIERRGHPDRRTQESVKHEREFSQRNMSERRLLSRDDIAERLEVSLENSRRVLEGEIESFRQKQPGEFALDNTREKVLSQRPLAAAGRSPMELSGDYRSKTDRLSVKGDQGMSSSSTWERSTSPDRNNTAILSRNEKEDVLNMNYKDKWEHQRIISAGSKPGLTITIENFRNPTPPKDSGQELPLDKSVSFYFFLKYLHDNFESNLKFLSDRIRVIYIRASKLEQEEESSSVGLLKETSCRDVVIDIGYKLTELAQDSGAQGVVPYKIKWALAQISSFLAKTAEQGVQSAARLPSYTAAPYPGPSKAAYEGRTKGYSTGGPYTWRDNNDNNGNLVARTTNQQEVPRGAPCDRSPDADRRYRTVTLENIRRDVSRDEVNMNNSMYQWKGESPNSRVYSDIPVMDPPRDLSGHGASRPGNPERNMNDSRFFPDNPGRNFMPEPRNTPSRRILRLEDIDFSFLDSREPQVTQNLNSLTIMLQNFASLSFGIQRKLLDYLKKAEVTKMDELRQLRAAIHGQQVPQHPPQNFSQPSQSEEIRRAMTSPGFMAFAPKEIPDRNPPPKGYPTQMMANTGNYYGNMQPY